MSGSGAAVAIAATGASRLCQKSCPAQHLGEWGHKQQGLGTRAHQIHNGGRKPLARKSLVRAKQELQAARGRFDRNRRQGRTDEHAFHVAVDQAEAGWPRAH
jgi:hypothetical protein